MRIAVYPGTFDPVHNGHIDIAHRAAMLFDKLIVGVYDRPNKSLMFSTEERVAMFVEALKDVPNAVVQSYTGLTVDFVRKQASQVIVRGLRVISDFELEYQMALMNRRLAPEVDTVCLMTSFDYAFISSSLVKDIALAGGPVSSLVPPHVERALRARAGRR